MAKFYARIPNYHGDEPDDGYVISTYDAENAAKDAAMRYEHDGDYLDEDERVNVIVTDEHGTEEKFVVCAYVSRGYSAEAVEEFE